MAGFGGGRGYRQGKRPSSSSSSSSSYFSTVTAVIFLAFCLLGLWMLTSSSTVPSHVITSRRSRSRASFAASLSPPSHFDDNPGDLPDDALKGDHQRGGEGKIEEVRGEEEEDGGGDKMDDTAAAIRLAGDQEKESEQRTEGGEEAAGGGGGENGGQQEEEGGQGGDDGAQKEEKLGGGDEAQEEQQQTKVNGEEQQENGGGGNQQESDGNGEENSENHDESPKESEQLAELQRKEKLHRSEEKTLSGGDENEQELEQQTTNRGEEDRKKLEEQQTTVDEGGEKSGEGSSEGQESEQQQVENESNENQQPTESEGEEGQQQSHGEGENQQQTESESEEQKSPQKQTEGESEGSSENKGEIQQQSEESLQQKTEEKLDNPNAGDSLPDGAQLEAANDGDGQNRPWATQADHSENEKERRKESSSSQGDGSAGEVGNILGQKWELCNVTAQADYIPCLDNEKALKVIHNTGHYEHRERHCPEEGPKCLVPLPEGYKHSIEWPRSRDKIWYKNVPHTKLAEVKGHQNWVKVKGEYLTFPGGGTQFIHGALHYIDFIQKAVPRIAWGKHTRVILDVGCGVASFGGYLFDRDVLAMSFAPKDEHEAQVQFALERGIPAISAVMGTQRLPFPSRVFDIVHCARCRVPWHRDGGALLLELNRVLRPGGYFVWSATPVYQKLQEDVEIWKEMSALTISMCWDLVTIKKDRLNGVGAAVYRKPVSNECYDNRKNHSPPMCKEDDDANAAWYVPLQSCMHRVPIHSTERGSQWPADWPRRVQVPPYWLNSSQMGIYGKPAPDDFTADFEHWKRVVNKSYLSGLGISWSNVRNVMDMRAIYGGFAAALKDLKIWVMNVVNIDSPDTLPIIFERGFFGIYHDWCESFSTYPRTYDLLHADHLFSGLKKRCDLLSVMAEVDRIVRPGGKIIIRDESNVVSEVESILKSLHWDVHLTFSKGQEGILSAEKSDWRPETFSSSS